jgi:hypothetical protein
MKTHAGFGIAVLAGALGAGGAEPPETFEYALGEAAVTTLAERQQTIGRGKLIGAADGIMKRYTEKSGGYRLAPTD